MPRGTRQPGPGRLPGAGAALGHGNRAVAAALRGAADRAPGPAPAGERGQAHPLPVARLRQRAALRCGGFPETADGVSGGGTVHHIAFRVKDSAEQLRWRELLVARGLAVTPVVDRTYFQSIYFREAGGVLLELATDPPGFTIDEPAADLGRRTDATVALRSRARLHRTRRSRRCRRSPPQERTPLLSRRSEQLPMADIVWVTLLGHLVLPIGIVAWIAGGRCTGAPRARVEAPCGRGIRRPAGGRRGLAPAPPDAAVGICGGGASCGLAVRAAPARVSLRFGCPGAQRDGGWGRRRP